MTQNSINIRNPVLQVVSTIVTGLVTLSTAIPADDTIPQNTEGDEVITVSITPKLSTSLLEITFVAGAQGQVREITSAALFQDTTASALAAKGIYVQVLDNMYFQHYMISGTTSATTFKIRCGSPSGTGYINFDAASTRAFGGVCTTILRVVEYLQ